MTIDRNAYAARLEGVKLAAAAVEAWSENGLSSETSVILAAVAVDLVRLAEAIASADVQP